MNCSNCGTENVIEAKFCRNCGERFIKKEITKQQEDSRSKDFINYFIARRSQSLRTLVPFGILLAISFIPIIFILEEEMSFGGIELIFFILIYVILIIIFKNNIKKRYAKINKIDIKLMDEKILLIDFIKNTKVFLTTKRLIRIDINGNTIFTANVNEDIENISRMTANRICIKLKNGRKEILPVGQMKNIWFDVLTNLKK